MTFDLLYFDPPWEFTNKKTGGSMKSGAGQKYQTLPLDDICALPVPAIAHTSACLALWVPTALKFSHGLAVTNAWGFDYITTVYWNKCRMGMGFWFRNQVEELLICQRRGGSLEPFKCQLPNIVSLPPEEHSRKPEEFRRLLESATGKISRRQCVEGFARRQVPGWTAIGDQVTGRDIRADIRLLALAPNAGQ